MDQQELLRLRAQFSARLAQLRDQLFGSALAMLREDIGNPAPVGADAQADDYMRRANEVGLALGDTGFVCAARALYSRLLEEASSYCRQTGNARHLGALHANMGLASLSQGSTDDGLVRLLMAAADDELIYNVPRDQSYALTGLLHDAFSAPTRFAALKAASSVSPALTIADVEALQVLLGRGLGYAFLAYVHQALTHREVRARFANEFSDMQLLSALLGLSALLEAELKTKAGDASLDFYGAARAVYEGHAAWWPAFRAQRKVVVYGTPTPPKGTPRRDPDQQLREAVASAGSPPTFWQSLLVAYVIRNYAVHYLGVPCSLITDYADEAVSHLLHAMIAAPHHW